MIYLVLQPCHKEHHRPRLNRVYVLWNASASSQCRYHKAIPTQCRSSASIRCLRPPGRMDLEFQLFPVYVIIIWNMSLPVRLVIVRAMARESADQSG